MHNNNKEREREEGEKLPQITRIELHNLVTWKFVPLTHIMSLNRICKSRIMSKVKKISLELNNACGENLFCVQVMQMANNVYQQYNAYRKIFVYE